MSLVLRSFFSYQVAVGSTMSEYRQVVLMRKSSVTTRSSLPSGALSCHTTSRGLAVGAQVLALHAVAGAQQVLEEVLVALARGAQDVGAPHEQVARPVGRMVRVLAGGHAACRPSAAHDVVLAVHAAAGITHHLQRIGPCSCGADGSQPMRSARTL